VEQLRVIPSGSSETTVRPASFMMQNGRGKHHWLPRGSAEDVLNEGKEPYRGVVIELLVPEDARRSKYAYPPQKTAKTAGLKSSL
jgi:hypothetical protein